jgi:hypothetical protein
MGLHDVSINGRATLPSRAILINAVHECGFRIFAEDGVRIPHHAGESCGFRI